MNEPLCNGVKIRGLNQDSDRVSVQSSLQSTWMLTRRRHAWQVPIAHDVGIAPRELLVVKGQESAQPELELAPQGSSEAILIVQSSRHGTRVLRCGTKHVYRLARGETLLLRTAAMANANQEPGLT